MSFRTTTQCRIVLAFSTLLSLSLAACDNEATAPELNRTGFAGGSNL